MFEETFDFNPKRVILLPASGRLQAVRDCLHLDDEFGTGIPAQRTVSETFMKELLCKRWNFPKWDGHVLTAGDILVPKYLAMDVIFLDGRPMGSVTFRPNEILTIEIVGHDAAMDEFVFQPRGRKFLPVDREMFDRIAA